MGKLFFFTGEAIRAIRRNVAPTTAAVVTTVLTALLLGVLIPVFQTAQSKGEEVRGQLELRAYVYDDATKEETAALQQRLEGLPHVETVSFLTKQDAKAEFLASEFGKKNPDALKQLGDKNPLPANYIIKADDAANLEAIRNSIQPVGKNGKATYISPVISEVGDRREDRREIEQVTGALKLILTVITVLLIGASLLLIGNTIRLSIYTRRREIEVMRLVGATRWFIRWPFMIEGVVVGVLGGAIAILMLWIGKVTVVDPLSDKWELMRAQDSMSFAALVACLFIAAILVSAVGSGLTMRRFLKV